MENPADHSGLGDWTVTKRRVRLDIDDEVQEKLAGDDPGTLYVQRRRQSIRFTEETQVEEG